MKKKKILFVTRKYPPQTGGMENLCYYVAQNIPNDEFEINVVSLGKKQIHLIWFLPYALLYIMFHARKYDFLLIGDGLMCMCGNICRLFAKKVQRLIVLHGLDITYSNFLYQMYLHMFLKKSSDLYICNSNNTKKIVENWGIQKNIIVITPGINTESFSQKTDGSDKEFRDKYNIPDEDLILITVGRLVKRKGVAWFVENVMPHTQNVTYLVIGEGAEKENIQSEIIKNDLSGRVKLLGRLSDDDWLECYQYADVFVMPNIRVENDVEGFGIVAAEASLAGLIVVASGIEGITDAIQHEKNGILVESENAEAYIDVLKSIQNNKTVWTEKAENYSMYTKKHYSWNVICEQYRINMKKLEKRER